MSVKDRIKSMNSLISDVSTEAKDAEEAFQSRGSISSMGSRNSSISLTSAPWKPPQRSNSTPLKSQGSETSLRSRSSEISMSSPLQLPGMETEKGAGRFEEEDPQDTDIEDVIQRLKDDDCTLTEVNLNNHGGLDAELKAELFEALVDNTYLEVLQLCNVKLDEGEAAELGRVLKMNCTLRVLSLESNRITRKGIKALMRCLSENPDTSIKELRLANQYFAGGAGAEGEIAKYLDKIKTITKLGYNFTVPSFRSKVDGLILRNLDYDRKRRAAMAD